MTDADAIERNYVGLVGRRGVAAELFALRTESAAARRILVHGATGGRLTVEELEHALWSDLPLDLDPEWAGRLARTIAWQSFFPTDRQLALELFARVMPHLGGDRTHTNLRQAYAELLITESRFASARDVMAAHPHVAGEGRQHYWTDIHSPFSTSPFADHGVWTQRFSAQFERHGLLGVHVEQGDGDPFDRVRGEDGGPHRIDGGPLVTVIMTTFRPERASFHAAVRSILDQTWRHLELIVVDDASPAQYESLLREVERLDPRVRVERMLVNGGTYLARNRALELARGEFFANQDADDWSHPQRIERQLRPLLAEPSLPGTRAAALTVTSALRQTRPGYGAAQQHAGTFMSRVGLVQEVGGYLRARRAADNELHGRLEAYTGQRVHELTEPLALYRIAPHSLSRGDFRAGWSHPARQSFVASYRHWHAVARGSDLRLDGGRPPRAGSQPSTVTVPRRFQVVRPPGPVRYDLVVLTDWRFGDEAQRAAYDEVIAAVRTGLRVGVLHLETPVRMSPRRGLLAREIQELINRQTVQRVLLDDAAAIARLVVRDPAVLQYHPITDVRLDVASIDVMVDDDAACGVWYTRRECEQSCEAMFGVRPTWRTERPAWATDVGDVVVGRVPDLVGGGEVAGRAPGPRDRDDVVGGGTVLPGGGDGVVGGVPVLLDDGAVGNDWSVLADEDERVVPYVDRRTWAADRRRRRGALPVVGWVDDSDWAPGLRPEVEAYLGRSIGTGVGLDIRIRASGAVCQALAGAGYAAGWVKFRPEEISVRAFLHSVDVLVAAEGQSPTARVNLEALAAGCVLVVPLSWVPVFGDAAVYASAESVGATVAALVRDRARVEEHVGRGLEYLSRMMLHRPAPVGQRV